MFYLKYLNKCFNYPLSTHNIYFNAFYFAKYKIFHFYIKT